MKLPHIIGLCGNPHSGKTEVQKILTELGSIPVDDGRPMRKFCVDWLGMDWDDVLTEEGKKGFVEINGRRWQRREILGEIGNKLEEMFGPNGIPYFATRRLDQKLSYSFGSVRREQGNFYQTMRGVVIGVHRRGNPPSPYEFDKFNTKIVNYWISNHGTLDDLRREVAVAIKCLMTAQFDIKWVSV